MLISNTKLVFFNSSPKIPKYRIFGQKYSNKAFLVLHKILELDKFEGADFKYDNNFFQITAQKYPNKAFLVRNSQIFIFAPNFATRQIRGR